MKADSAANYCIYCGSSAGKLSSEHVFPYALGGELVIPKSSCAECAKKTSQTELFVLRRMFGTARSKLKMRSRKPHNRPEKYPVTFTMEDGSSADKLVPSDDYPFHFTCIIYPPARALRGALPSLGGQLKIGFWSTCDEDAINNLKLKYGAADVSLHMLDLNSTILCRFLAKMAHGYAFATEAQDYIPLTREFILGLEIDPNFLVGCEDTLVFEADKDDGLFLKTWISRSHYPGFVVAFIQFFPARSAPVYHVVVGIMPSLLKASKSSN